MQQASEEKVDDPNSPAYLLSNLDIAVTDCFADSSHNVAARNAAAQLVASQVAFYVACLLRGFEAKTVPQPPVILVIGAGFMGSAIMEVLLAHGCGPLLHVYCRGDMAAQAWRRRGLKSSPSLSRLMKDTPRADIIILATGLSGFTNTAKLVAPYTTPATAVITSSLGLQRKRIFASLKTLGCFRTYIEPRALVRHVRASARQAGIHHHSFDDAVPVVIKNTPEGPVVTGGILGEAKSGGGGGGGADDNDDDDDDDGDLPDFDDASSMGGSDAYDSIKTFTSREQFVFLAGQATGGLANAADLIAQRTPDVVGIVTVLENYFSLLGLKHMVARAQALFAVLGYAENTAMGLASSTLATANFAAMLPELQRALRKSDDDDDDTTVRQDMARAADAQIRRIQQLSSARAALEQAISPAFQRQLSRYIRVLDIPRLSDFITEADRNKPSRRATARLSRLVVPGTAGDLASVAAAVASQHGPSVEAPSPARVAAAAAAAAAAARAEAETIRPIHPDKKITHIFALDCRFRTAIIADWDDDCSQVSLESGSMLGFDDVDAGGGGGMRGGHETPRELLYADYVPSDGVKESALLAMELGAKARADSKE